METNNNQIDYKDKVNKKIKTKIDKDNNKSDIKETEDTSKNRKIKYVKQPLTDRKKSIQDKKKE